MKTGKAIERDVFAFIKSSPIKGEIRGEVYREGMRPHDAKTEDAVVAFLAGLDGQTQTGVVNINIYVPDLVIRGKAVEDIGRCEILEHLAATSVREFPVAEYYFTLDGIPQTFQVEGIEQHVINVRVKFRRKSL